MSRRQKNTINNSDLHDNVTVNARVRLENILREFTQADDQKNSKHFSNEYSENTINNKDLHNNVTSMHESG